MIEKILSLALKQAQQAEVLEVESEETPAKFEANRLKELQTRYTKGYALRVIKDGRIGFASSTRQDDAPGLVEAAVELAQFGAEAHFSFPPAALAPEVGVYDAAVEQLEAAALKDMGVSVIDRVLAHTPEVVCDGSVRKGVSRIRIANSAGGGGEYRKTYLTAGIEGVLIRGTDMLFVGDWLADTHAFSDAGTIATTMTRQLDWSRNTLGSMSGHLPVLFLPLAVAGGLVEPLGLAFSGRNVFKKSSPIGDKLGQRAYDQRLTIVDDATEPAGISGRPFDDEGVPSRPNVLVEAGVVKTFLYDLQTAGQAGAESTGSAERSLETRPAISPSSLIVSPGTASFEEMLGSIDEGLIVEQMLGAGQGNTMGGELSANVLLGYRVERGEVVGRVKDTVIACNVHEALASIRHIGSDQRWVGGSLKTPSICFESLSISGKGG
jgi:PmbA protein